MAVLCAIGTGNYLQRTTGLLDPAQDSTYIVWVKEPAAVAVSPAYNTSFAILDDPGVYAEYARLITKTGSGGTSFEVVGDAARTTTSPSAAQWNFYAWIQNGTEQYFQKNGTRFNPRTADRSGFTVGYDLLGNDTFGPGGLTVAYVRQWQAALTPQEIIAERNSRTAIRTADLFLDCPLESDLLDVSGNGHTWTAVGATSFVAPPVTPILDTPAVFPYTRVVTQAEFNVANEVWFQFDIAAATVMGFQTTSGGTFTPLSRLYFLVGPDNTTTKIKEVTSNAGWWTYFPEGRYLLRISRNGGGASNFDFTVNCDEAALMPAGPAPLGTILINDDARPDIGTYYPAFLATTWSQSMGLYGFLTNIPPGEVGDALPSGISLWHDELRQMGIINDAVFDGDGLYLALFDANQQYITSVNTTPAIASEFPCICNNGERFYVLNTVTGEVSTVSQDGSVSAVIATLPYTLQTTRAIGVSRDGTILYFANGLTDPTIFRWDLTTDTALPDFYTVPELSGLTMGPDNYLAVPGAGILNPGEILVLTDDTVVTYCRYEIGGTPYSLLMHLSADGVRLAAYSYLTTPDRVVHHIHYGPNNPDDINIWFYGPAETEFVGIFGQLSLATGVVANEATVEVFSNSSNRINRTEMFGPSSSCPMVTIGYPDVLTPEVGFATELPIRWVLKTPMLRKGDEGY